MKRIILLALALLAAAPHAGAAVPRADWMRGKYGLMVHWLFPRQGSDASVNGPVDAFDIPAFLRDFDASGASWLFFTIGQNAGAYAAPNAALDRLAGPGHCARRDLVGELAAAVRARGKRFVAYLPGDALVPSIARATGYSPADLHRHAFQTNWTGVIREWALRYGRNLDGWWFDGMNKGRFPHGFDVKLWADAARAGNPDRALAFSWTMYRVEDGQIRGPQQNTPEDDYLGGEFNLMHDARIRCDYQGARTPTTWMPRSAYVPGTPCLHHALFCLDSFWPAWAAWPAFFGTGHEFRRHPDHFSQAKMNALRAAGRFPDPIFPREEFLKFVHDFTAAGGGVTVNVGISEKGRLNPQSLAYLKCLRPAAGVVAWSTAATRAEDGSVETRGTLCYAGAGTAATVRGVAFAPFAAGRAPLPQLALDEEVHAVAKAFMPAADTTAAAALLRGGLWFDDYKHPQRPYGLTLKDLVPGRRYLVQLWCADRRKHGLVRGMTAEGTADLPFRSDGRPYGTTATGVFTAEASAQTLLLAPNGSSFQLNALQVRELEAAGPCAAAPARATWCRDRFGFRATEGAWARDAVAQLAAAGATWLEQPADDAAPAEIARVAAAAHAHGLRFVAVVSAHAGAARAQALAAALGAHLDAVRVTDARARDFPLGAWRAAARWGAPERALWVDGIAPATDAGAPAADQVVTGAPAADGRVPGVLLAQMRHRAGRDVAAVPDASRAPAPEGAKLTGYVGAKADRFLARRVFSDYARNVMFAEAEKAFDTHFDDDPAHPHAGFWQGEYWGKLMLGLVEGARYGHDARLKAWCLERARLLIRRHQRPDGYLCTYRDETLLTYPQRWNWNIWGRKYTLWALLAIHEATGAEDILQAAAKLADHLIASLHRQQMPIWKTGCYAGLPSMSILKPILLLYRAKPEARYLAFAREIVAGWERAGNPAPNLLVNAFSERPVADWYGVPEEWAKAYEFMSCLEGLVEYHRITGERRVLDAVARIWEKLALHEANPVGTVAYFDHFYNAASIPDGMSEPCDSTHWIRLSRELFLLTGDGKYLDAIERAFYNGFLAGVWRDGSWGAHAVRSHGRRHRAAPRQVGMENTQCCVANMPRTFFDVARTAVTRLADGTVSVNLLGDSETAFDDGVKVTVSGNYPVNERVTVRVASAKSVKVRVRVPDACPWVDVKGLEHKVLMLYAKVQGGWYEFPAARAHDLALAYRMPARVVPFKGVAQVPGAGTWADRFWSMDNPEAAAFFRTAPAARIEKGPLILAKAKAVGDAEGDIFAASIDGRGFGARLEPLPATNTWGAWKLILTGRDGTRRVTNVCDFQSTADGEDAQNAFSVWF